MKKIKIDFSQFILDDSDKKRMKSLDNITIKSDPNYQTNKRINLKYSNEDDYSNDDNHEELETSGDIEMGIY